MGEVWERDRRAAQTSGNISSDELTTEEAYDERIDQIKKAIGEELTNPFRRGGTSFEFGLEESDPFEDFANQLRALAERHPEHRDIIRPDFDPRRAAEARARADESEADRAFRRYGPGLGKYIARFGGAMHGGLYDPVNLFSMGIGPVGAARVGAAGLLRMAGWQGLANAGVELAFQPAIASWRHQAGLSYTASDAFLNIGAAFALGGLADLGIRGAWRGARRLQGRVPYLDPDGGVVRWVTPDDLARITMPDLPPVPDIPQDLAEKAAAGDFNAMMEVSRILTGRDPTLPEGITPDIAQAAMRGEIDAVQRVAEATGLTENPAIKGLLDRAMIEGDNAEVQAALQRVRDEFAGVTTPDGGRIDIDIGQDQQRILQALRAALDPDEPTPTGGMDLAIARRPALADDEPLPRGTQGTNQHELKLDIFGRTAAVREIDLKLARIEGDVQALRAQQWSPDLAGRVLAFEPREGPLVIMDGRRRAELAQRVPEARAEAVVFREADGWTQQDVAGLARRKNAAEGKGSPVELAESLRTSPELLDLIEPDTLVTRTARSLAMLSDDAFGMVKAGEADPRMAAMVSDMVANEALHAQLLRDLRQAGIDDLTEARRSIRDLLPSTGAHEANATLLGLEPDEMPLRAGADVEDPTGPAAKAQVQRLERDLAPEIADARAKGPPPPSPIETAVQAVERVNAIRAAIQQVVGRAPDGMPPRMSRVSTPDGSATYPVAFEVVDARTLQAATGELQPRDRSTRAASQTQVQSMAANLNPDLLIYSAQSDRGAPIIDDTGTVLSGNGRVAAINAAREMNAEGYRAYVQRLNEEGFGTAGIERPVLVRRITGLDDAAKREFVVKSNQDDKLAMSPAEQARVDQDLMTDDVLALLDPDGEAGLGSAANRRFVRAVMDKMSPAQRGAFVGEAGELTPAGVARLEAAIFARAYGDRTLVTRIVEDQEGAGLRNALLGAAPAWAQMRAVAPAEFDITPNLVEAVQAVTSMRERRIKPAEFFAQQDAFSQVSPLTETLVRAFYNEAGTRAAAWRTTRDTLKNYARIAMDQGNAVGDLLGAKPSAQSILEGQLRSRADTEPALMFAFRPGRMPADFRVETFSAIGDLPDPIQAEVARGNAVAFANALQRLQAARTPAARARALADMEAAKRGQGVEGFERDGVIYVATYAVNPDAVLHHEIVHWLKRTQRITDDEIALLAKRARKEGLLDEALYREAMAGRENLDALLDEEAAARLMQARKEGRSFGRKADGIIDKALRTLEMIGNALRGYGFRTADDVVEAILSGEMARRGLLPDQQIVRMGDGAMFSLRQDVDMSPEARKVRAEAMGFDTGTVWYHGTRKADLEGGSFKADWIGGQPAVWFTDEPELSNVYTGQFRGMTPPEGAGIIPVYLRLRNPLEVNANRAKVFEVGQEFFAERLQRDFDTWKERALQEVPKIFSGRDVRQLRGALQEMKTRTDLIRAVEDYQMTGEGPIATLERRFPESFASADDVLGPPNAGITDVLQFARDNGHDGVIFRNISDVNAAGVPVPQTQVAVFDPKNIRSVNAEFDPASADSPNIMFSLRQDPPDTTPDLPEIDIPALAQRLIGIADTYRAALSGESIELPDAALNLGRSEDGIITSVQAGDETYFVARDEAGNITGLMTADEATERAIADTIHTTARDYGYDLDPERVEAYTAEAMAIVRTMQDDPQGALQAASDLMARISDEITPDEPAMRADNDNQVPPPLRQDLADVDRLNEHAMMVEVCR